MIRQHLNEIILGVSLVVIIAACMNGSKTKTNYLAATRPVVKEVRPVPTSTRAELPALEKWRLRPRCLFLLTGGRDDRPVGVPRGYPGCRLRPPASFYDLLRPVL